MKHPTSRMLFDYWDRLRGDRVAPNRADLEPGAIRHILADVFLLEAGAGRETRFRLAGTRCCALFGRELKGETFDSLWSGAGRAEIDDLVTMVRNDNVGVVAGMVGATPDAMALDLELVLLPLRHRNSATARILGALSTAYLPSWVGLRHITRLRTTSQRVLTPEPRRRAPILGGDEPGLVRRMPFVVHVGGRT